MAELCMLVPPKVSGLSPSGRGAHGVVCAMTLLMACTDPAGDKGSGRGHSGAADSAISTVDSDTSVVDSDTEATSARWIGVDAGMRVVCGVRETGAVACWGSDEFGLVSGVPAGEFMAVSVGYLHACALDAAGIATCWGDDVYGGVSSAPGDPLIALTTGAGHSCGVRSSDGHIICWGLKEYGLADAPPDAGYRAVGAGQWFACAIHNGGGLSCWGQDDTFHDEVVTAPPGTFVAVDGGSAYACALSEEGSPICWGAVFDPRVSTTLEEPPAEAFAALSVGGRFACGVTAETGSLLCWSDGVASSGDGTLLGDVPDGEFLTVSVGSDIHFYYGFGCAITVDGAMTCWGSDTYGETSPPEDEGE